MVLETVISIIYVFAVIVATVVVAYKLIKSYKETIRLMDKKFELEIKIESHKYERKMYDLFMNADLKIKGIVDFDKDDMIFVTHLRNKK